MSQHNQYMKLLYPKDFETKQEVINILDSYLCTYLLL